MAKAKKASPTLTLKQFLTQLAQDAEKLGRFIHDPEKSIKAAGLSPEDGAALRSGFPRMIYARIAGLSIKKAFVLPPPKHTLQPHPFHPTWDRVPTQVVKPIKFPELAPHFQFQPPPFYWGKLSGSRKGKTESKAKRKSKGRG
jgi:hypothetical protein